VHIGPRNTQNQAQQIASNPQDVKDPGLYDDVQIGYNNTVQSGYAAVSPPPLAPTTKRDWDEEAGAARVRIGAPALSASERAAATGNGAWEMVDYQQYQQHGVILPTVAPRFGGGGPGRRQTALHPMVLNYTSPIGEFSSFMLMRLVLMLFLDLIDGWDESDAYRPTHY
jgi:hypothetical protein